MRAFVVAIGISTSGCDVVLGLQRAVPDASTNFDSDRDEVVDLLDNCAGVVNPEQADTDVDGVGDACDPHPGMRDSVVALELFHGAGRWAPMPAVGWTRTEGLLVSPAGGSLVFDATQRLLMPALQVGFTFVNFGPRNDASNNEIALELEDADTANCQAREDVETDTESNLLLHVHGTPTPVIKPIQPPLELESPYLITYARGMTTECSINGFFATAADAPTNTLSVKPTIKLRVAAVRIHFIAIYQVAP